MTTKKVINDLIQKIRNSHEIYKNASDEDLFYYGLGFVIDDLKERGLIK